MFFNKVCVFTGTEQEDTERKVVCVLPSPDISYHILSMSMAESLGEDLVETNVGAFLVIQKVDMENRVSQLTEL